jgi:hypothetical protein
MRMKRAFAETARAIGGEAARSKIPRIRQKAP